MKNLDSLDVSDRANDRVLCSPVLTCTRRLQFCSGHRVLRHEGKCSMLHGHNYVVFFEARADCLDPLGRVIDFSELKTRLGGWLEEHWDHGFILNASDHEARAALAQIPGQRVYTIPDNPTAECLALYLLLNVCPNVLCGTGVEIVRVTLWETENCYAHATL
jgi:6-pyruvoyltetrahydropterin/6-carboxytetrahydropterin synthase